MICSRREALAVLPWPGGGTGLKCASDICCVGGLRFIYGEREVDSAGGARGAVGKAALPGSIPGRGGPRGGRGGRSAVCSESGRGSS